MKKIACISFVWLSLFASCDKASKMPYEPPAQEEHTIAYLKSLCPSGTTVIAQDIVVRGTVTGNDHYGEFAKTLVVEDASGGITVAADHTALSDSFPFGCEVTLYCNGLTLAEYGGKVVLGAAPDGQYGVTRIAQQEIARHIRRSAPGDVPHPATLAFGDVTALHTDRYVRFDGVRFTQPEAWCDTDPETLRPVTTERQIEDSEGRTFTVRTAASCVYATEPVPSGTGSVYGIIDYFGGKFSLRITDRRAVFATSAALPTACPSTAGYSAPIPTK